MSRGNKKVKMVGLPRLELGTCGAREWSRILASQVEIEAKMVGLPRVIRQAFLRQAPLWGLTMMSRGDKEVKMVGLPRLELGTCRL